MTAAPPPQAASSGDRTLVVRPLVRNMLREIMLLEASRLERAADLCRKHGVKPLTPLDASAAELRALAEELGQKGTPT